MSKLVMVIWIFALLPCLCWAAELTGRDIALRMDAVDTSKDYKRTAIMVINRKGQKLVRKMESCNKKYGPDERGLIKFIDPPDVRGIMYLTWSYEDVERDDDMWVFLPAESLVRRISGGGKKGSFMRSDFANEDIEKREVDDEHRLLRSEKFSGVDCYVVERVSKKQKDTNYSKRITWVRKDIWLPMKIEYFNKREKHIKTGIYGGFKEIKGIWTITKIMVETPRKGSKTLMQYDNVDYNIGLSDSLFEQSNLKR
ncbi:MAG: outer membrane lipoprotein-sorting protein [Deltaproteobacteria bacterium]|nr:MAG: outer membrane lipoprotein-sorting protein [Deltaproteobacteria bacterium]